MVETLETKDPTDSCTIRLSRYRQTYCGRPLETKTLPTVLPTDCPATDGPVVVEAFETEDVQHSHGGLHLLPVALDVRVDRRH